MRVPRRKAAPIPDAESPAISMGEPATKIRRLLKTADFHVGGADWIRARASARAPWADIASGGVASRESRGLGLRFGRTGGFGRNGEGRKKREVGRSTGVL